MKKLFKFSILVILATSCAGLKIPGLGGNKIDQNRKVSLFASEPLKGGIIKSGPNNVCLSQSWRKDLEALKEKINKSTKPNPVDLAHLADCLAMEEDFSGALFYYDLALAHAPSSKFKSAVYSNMSNMYLYLESPALAEETINQSLKFNPNNHLSRYKLALLAYKQGNFHASLDHLETLQRTFQSDTNILAGIAANLYQLKNFNSIISNILPQMVDKNTNEAWLLSEISDGKEPDDQLLNELKERKFRNGFIQDLGSKLLTKEAQSGKNYEEKT